MTALWKAKKKAIDIWDFIIPDLVLLPHLLMSL